MNAQTIIRKLCIDDHPMVREGLAGVIKGQRDMSLVAKLQRANRESRSAGSYCDFMELGRRCLYRELTKPGE
jgi:hypothetical protein